MKPFENTIPDANPSEEATYIENDINMLDSNYKSLASENKHLGEELNNVSMLLSLANNKINDKDNKINEQDKVIAEQVDKISKLNDLLKEANLYVTSEIPNSFEVLMQTYNVIGMEGDDNNCHGKANCANGKLVLYSAVNNAPQNKNVLELTFYHELAHIILNSIGENELFENERLVEMLGRGIYSFLKTRKYDTQSKDRE